MESWVAELAFAERNGNYLCVVLGYSWPQAPGAVCGVSAKESVRACDGVFLRRDTHVLKNRPRSSRSSRSGQKPGLPWSWATSARQGLELSRRSSGATESVSSTLWSHTSDERHTFPVF